MKDNNPMPGTKTGLTITETIAQKLDIFFAMHEGHSPETGLHARIMDEVERVLILKTIEHTGDVQTKAAKILGINRNTLRKKMQRLNILNDKS